MMLIYVYSPTEKWIFDSKAYKFEIIKHAGWCIFFYILKKVACLGKVTTKDLSTKFLPPNCVQLLFYSVLSTLILRMLMRTVGKNGNNKLNLSSIVDHIKSSARTCTYRILSKGATLWNMVFVSTNSTIVKRKRNHSQRKLNKNKGSLRPFKFRHIKTVKKKLVRGSWLGYVQSQQENEQSEPKIQKVGKSLEIGSSDPTNSSLYNPNEPILLDYSYMIENASSILSQIGPSGYESNGKKTKCSYTE